MSDLSLKYDKLLARLREIDTLCICYSGGVDSAFLMRAAHEALADRVFAIIADVCVLPRRELAKALSLADETGVKCHVLIIDALSVPELRNNDIRRCYYCKKNIFSAIVKKAQELGATDIADGKNLDDASVYRPGAQAATELKVISPLFDAGFTKADIREMSRILGLKTWDKPANACLATRLPTNTEATTELLNKIEAAEELMHDAGFLNCRARVHGELLRVELPKDRIADFLGTESVLSILKQLGFKYVTVDVFGLKSGSMDG